MNKATKMKRALTNERITFEMSMPERRKAMKDKLAKQKAEQELALRKKRIAEKKAKGLVHYQSIMRKRAQQR